MTQRNEQQRQHDVDLTPMVDVTFLILIFFMVTASFSMQQAIETPNPVDDRPSPNVAANQQQPVPVRLRVDRDGCFLLMAPDWQKEIVGKQSLVSELLATRNMALNNFDLKIEVESAAKLQRLVDAIDAAAIAGFDQFQLAEIDSEVI